jgi:hypothetical protein
MSGGGVDIGHDDEEAGPASAAPTASASGMLSTGLVAMTQIALIRPSATAWNISTAFSPDRKAMTGEFQKRCTMPRWAAFSMSI